MSKAIVKTVTWRVLATLITFTASFVVTGSFTSAISISGAEVIVKSLAYYLHEIYYEKIT